ncbi:MAG TPA: hypothetical protein VGV39_25500 [Mesorhizobium sp.]|jgi:hypothetical protein|uniref:hypothetical protein n=1 Tax=Mesorhizobium sp. TaxID=1871066 RepID=UPI002DDD9CFB|nr:hypothetical protein [Mesorhizobium sp.]HEV2506455.1 hypothetical protein [Mesorhizobium sp.]
MARYPAFRWLKLAVAAALVAFLPSQAEAQIGCGLRDVIVARLGQLFHEHRIGYGLVGEVAVVEIYVSTAGTWTMLMTDVSGRTCIVGAGEGWENTPTADVRERDS